MTGVDLGPGIMAGFTSRATGNLSHHQPHLPSRLAENRQRLARQLDLDVLDLHLMRQIHGATVGVVGADTPRGAELDGVDVLVTERTGRALLVQVADCVPVLLAVGDTESSGSTTVVAAVHAGRRGLRAGVVGAAVDTLRERTAGGRMRAAVGPAIGGCCYEVPESLRADVAEDMPSATARTTWGTPSLDLPRAVTSVLRTAGVSVRRSWPGCTRCDPGGRWFSHRRDPTTGRQAGVIAIRG